MRLLKEKVPKTVWLLGLVSLFNDISSEMLYPILPIFITQVLGAPVFVVGIIEGVAEGIAAFFKSIFGYWSDCIQKRKPFVVGGYGASAVSKLVIALAYSWPVVLLGRTLDKFGKGARTGARDALLLEDTNDQNKGFIFGLHRSMDSLGAVIGPIVSLLLLYQFHTDIRRLLFIATIPAFLSLIFFLFIKEVKKNNLTNKVKLSLSLKNYSPRFILFLVGMTIFSLGNSSDTFLILRAKNIGLNISLVISAYVLYNIVYSVASTPAGKLSDSFGAMKIFLAGICIYIVVYLGFALNTNPMYVWILFAVYGLHIALTDGVSKAIIGGMTSTEKAGSAYGVFYTFTSIATLFSSIIGGFLWSSIAPGATFAFAVICATISLTIFSILEFGKNSGRFALERV